MNYFDIILLVILAWFIYKGAKIGFVRIIGGFLGIIIGAWAAGKFYDLGAELLLQWFDMQLMLAIVLSFIAIFILVNVLISIISAVILNIFKVLPLATFANRIVGALLGLLQGLLIVGLIIWVITLFPFENSFSQKLKESEVAKYFEYSTTLVRPILPDSLKDVDFSFLQDLENFSDEKAERLKQNMPRFFDRIKEESMEFKNRIDQEIEASASEDDEALLDEELMNETEG